MANRIAKNRPSPKNEDAYIQAYLKVNPTAKKHDNLDVAAVITKSGEKGHALVKEGINRSHDEKYHRVEDFILDKELKKNM